MIRAFIGDAPIIDDAEAPAALVVTAGVRLPDLLRASCTMCHWENEAEPGESYPAGMRCPSCNSDVHIEPVNMEPRIDSIVSLHIAGDVELRTSEGGTRIDRATVRDGNGDVVANFLNVLDGSEEVVPVRLVLEFCDQVRALRDDRDNGQGETSAFYEVLSLADRVFQPYVQTDGTIDPKEFSDEEG